MVEGSSARGIFRRPLQFIGLGRVLMSLMLLSFKYKRSWGALDLNFVGRCQYSGKRGIKIG